jgi:glycosyltransferase involved in cell wall biosynthesis
MIVRYITQYIISNRKIPLLASYHTVYTQVKKHELNRSDKGVIWRSIFWECDDSASQLIYISSDQAKLIELHIQRKRLFPHAHVTCGCDTIEGSDSREFIHLAYVKFLDIGDIIWQLYMLQGVTTKCLRNHCIELYPIPK